ncbi:hypothetical protein MNBD_DELTA01-1518 [hydrothermal vent metagenome]|uniref:STAS domain-containing protein n=1 Tax=hydrothermal vent metagenome TaxID=652676 RepID=A0A3B0QSS8_9ZZZZ
MFKVNCRRDEMIVVADLEGVFDDESEDEIAKLSTGCAPTGDDCVIWNFKGVTDLTSSGIAILINACNDLEKNYEKDKNEKTGRCNEEGTKAFSRTKLSNLRPRVIDALTVHKLVDAFDIHPDELAAVKQIRMDLEKRGDGDAFTRLFERIDVRLKACFKEFREGGRTPDISCVFAADVTTLSRCGIFLHTEHLHFAGSVLDVELTLYDDDDGGTGNVYHKDAETISVNFVGKVVWIADEQKQADIYPGMALSIVSMEEDVKNMLEGYLASRGV